MLTGFDVGFGLLVLISAILATARGLTREVLSLITWAGSAALAWYMYQYHRNIAQTYIKEEIVANVATVAITFIVALIILHLITMWIADLVVDSRVGPLDRTLGFIFGALRGILIAIVVVFFGLWLFLNQVPERGTQVDLTKLPDWAGWAQGSKTLPLLAEWGGDLRGVLPDNADLWLTDLLKRGKGGAAAPTDTGASTPDDTAVPQETVPGADDTGGNDQPDVTEVPDSTTPPAAPSPPATGKTPAGSGA